MHDENAPVIVVSSDCHIGPRLVEDLRPYCPKEYLDDFDAFVDRLGALQREERKAVIMISYGWRLFEENEDLRRPTGPSRDRGRSADRRTRSGPTAHR